MEETECSQYSKWGGLLEAISMCIENINSESKVEKLRKKIDLLEATKTMEELSGCLKANFAIEQNWFSSIFYTMPFTKEEQDYLNSPLLDGLIAGINRSPLLNVIIREDYILLNFYIERGLDLNDFHK